MKLRMIEAVSFRSSEATNYAAWQRRNKDVRLGADDVVLFVSLTGEAFDPQRAINRGRS